MEQDRPVIMQPHCLHCLNPIADPDQVVRDAYKHKTRNNIARHPLDMFDLRTPIELYGWHLELVLHGRFEVTPVQVVEVTLMPGEKGVVENNLKNPWDNSIKKFLGGKTVTTRLLREMTVEGHLKFEYEAGVLRIGQRVVFLNSHDNRYVSELPIAHIFAEFNNQSI